MKHIFIDSNIWLSLYHFTKDDLDQFAKLKSYIQTGDVKLHLPEQVKNEVLRNRDAKIKDSLDMFKKFNFLFPAFCKGYDEYPDFQKKYSELKKEHTQWYRKIEEDIRKQELHADKIIREIFDACTVETCDEEIIRSAELRYKSGNPPGKDNSLGDAINWECLLHVVPENEDLFFISVDKDYRSVLDDESFNLYLQKEWADQKKSEIIYYKTLVDFLNAHMKEIKLQEEQHKNDLILDLQHSHSFRNTHIVIADLNQYKEWTNNQIEDMCEAALDNGQVNWLLGDDDVVEFYSKIIKLYKGNSMSVQTIKEELADSEETISPADIY